MIKLEEALRLIDHAVIPLPPKFVAPLDAVNCCVAEDVNAPISVPGFAASAMDGIAVAYADLAWTSHPELKLQGVIAAGSADFETLKPGHAFRIMTGAPLPPGADTVIPVEELRFAEDRVAVCAPAIVGQHVRPAGNDIKAGQLIFPQGYCLRPVDAGICAGLGLTTIRVHPSPSIALLATGSEIVPPGQALAPGQIYNANNPALRALLRTAGYYSVSEEPPLQDDLSSLRPKIEDLCSRHDAVITSGAVSAGDFDYIPKVMQDLGGRLLFHKVAIKPGKPALIARIGNSWLIGLPGNPVSVVVTYHLYTQRILRRLRGDKAMPCREKAVLKRDVKVKSDRFYVLGAYLERSDEALYATGCENYESGRLSSIRGIDGFIFLPEGKYNLPTGTKVDIEWL